jgi:hypothetical protein
MVESIFNDTAGEVTTWIKTLPPNDQKLALDAVLKRGGKGWFEKIRAAIQ